MMEYQQMIANLQKFWSDYGCVIVQPYNSEVGAGTFNPNTFLRALGPEPWKVAYVEPSKRPKDGRYLENPNRVHQFLQYQVVLKPNPANSQELYLESLRSLGIKPAEHDIRFVEDDWESPTLGAAGLGWEVWLDGDGGFPVHLFPAGGRGALQTRVRGVDLRSAASVHVHPGKRPRERHRLGGWVDLG